MAKNVGEKLELVPMIVTPKDGQGSTTADEKKTSTESVPIIPDEENALRVMDDTSDNTSSQPCPPSSTHIPIEGIIFLRFV